MSDRMHLDALDDSAITAEVERLLARRGAALGTILFIMLTDDPGRNLQLNFVSYAVAVLWSYLDGPFSQRRWSVAWFEGLTMHMIGVFVSNLLILIFGSPLPEGS